MLFGSNLRKYRKAHALSQEELAEAAEVSVKHIGALESGSSFISAELLETFCDVLNVSPHLFFVDESSSVLAPVALIQVEQIIRGRMNQTASTICQEVRQKILTLS